MPKTVPVPANHALVVSSLSDTPVALTPFTFS